MLYMLRCMNMFHYFFFAFEYIFRQLQLHHIYQKISIKFETNSSFSEIKEKIIYDELCA